MSEKNENMDSSSSGAKFEAVAAAPKHHKVIFESDRLRVLGDFDMGRDAMDTY